MNLLQDNSGEFSGISYFAGYREPEISVNSMINMSWVFAYLSNTRPSKIRLFAQWVVTLIAAPLRQQPSGGQWWHSEVSNCTPRQDARQSWVKWSNALPTKLSAHIIAQRQVSIFFHVGFIAVKQERILLHLYNLCSDPQSDCDHYIGWMLCNRMFRYRQMIS